MAMNEEEGAPLMEGIGLEWKAPEANPTPSLRFIGDVGKLLTAIANARREFGQVSKSREGQIGHQKFRYSPLGDLTAASIEPLSKQGVAVMQFLTTAPVEGRHRLTTLVAGHNARIESYLDFPPDKDIKEYGKQTTYLRRYAYNGIFVLDGIPDADEGNGRRKAPEEREVTEGQDNTIAGMFSKLSIPPDEREVYAERVVGKAASDFLYMDAEKLIKHLGTQIDAKKGAVQK